MRAGINYSIDGSIMYIVKSYGCGALFLDCFMVILTGGLWFIWMGMRAIKNQNKRNYFIKF